MRCGVDPVDDVGEPPERARAAARCRGLGEQPRGTRCSAPGAPASRSSATARRPAATTLAEAARAVLASGAARRARRRGPRAARAARTARRPGRRRPIATRAPRRGSMLDEALGRQRPQRLADRVARHVEAGRQLLLDEPLALGVGAADDRRAELVDHGVAERQVARADRQRSHPGGVATRPLTRHAVHCIQYSHAVGQPAGGASGEEHSGGHRRHGAHAHITEGRADALIMEDLAGLGRRGRCRGRRDRRGGRAAPDPAAAPTARPATPVEGAEITIALGSEPTSLDPHLVDDGGERAINDNIYETLLTRTPDGELIPAWPPTLPTQVDDTTWEFTLREASRSTTAQPFNADSVVATINRMIGLDRARRDRQRRLLLHAHRRTKRRRLHGADHDRRPRRRAPGAHVLAQDDPGRAPRRRRTCPTRRTAPARTRSSSRNQGVDIDARRQRRLLGRRARRSASVTYEFVSEGGTRLAGLKSGRYDLITNLPPQDVEQAPAVRSRPGPGAPDHHPRRRRGHHRRPQRPPGAQPRRRQGGDRREQVYGGFATVDAGQLLAPSILGYNDALEPYPYDPERGQAPARGGRRRRRRRSSSSASRRDAGSTTASWSRRSPATGPPPASTSQLADPRVRRLPRRAVRP